MANWALTSYRIEGNQKDLQELNNLCKAFIKNLSDIAANNGLELIETTSSGTGYPQALCSAIIGFDTFEEAEELAKEHNLDIEIFTKRDGWNLWYRTGTTAYNSLERSAEDYGDDYHQYTKADLADFYQNEVQPFIGEFNDFEDLRSFLDKTEKIKDEIEDAEEDEIVITYCGEYYETIKKETMAYEYDTHHYAIGLIDRSSDID